MFDFDPALLPTSKSPLSLGATQRTLKEKVCVCCTVVLAAVKVGECGYFQVVGISNLICVRVKINNEKLYDRERKKKGLVV